MFKAKDLRERTPEDLRELEKTLAKDVFQNRFKNFTNRLDDTSAIKKTRRDLARVKTVLAQLASAVLASAPAAEAAPAPAPKAAKPAKKAAPKAKKSKKSAAAEKEAK